MTVMIDILPNIDNRTISWHSKGMEIFLSILLKLSCHRIKVGAHLQFINIFL